MDQQVSNAEPVSNGKAEKFHMLAEKRVTKLLTGMRRVGNLSRRASYDYTPDEVAKMFDAIRKATDEAEARFTGGQNYFRF
jgi:hypothetical protein